jgi:glycosyltransferase involved in cell wall biosynthesis
VIVSEAGGLTEFVQEGHNGYIVQPEQVDQLAERLVDLLKDDEKCIEMGRNGLERVREVFNWEAVISRMAPYLEQAARMSGQNG